MNYKIHKDEQGNKYLESNLTTYKLDKDISDHILLSDNDKIVYLETDNRLTKVEWFSIRNGFVDLGKCLIKPNEYLITFDNQKINLINNEPIIDKMDFIQGGCVEFALALMKELKKLPPSILKNKEYEFGVIEGLVREEEDDGEYLYEACHGVVIEKGNLKKYFDVNGLNLFDSTKTEEYLFSSEPKEIRLRQIDEKELVKLFGGISKAEIKDAHLYIKQNPEVLKFVNEKIDIGSFKILEECLKKDKTTSIELGNITNGLIEQLDKKEEPNKEKTVKLPVNLSLN